MPYKDKKELYAAQKRYRQRVKTKKQENDVRLKEFEERERQRTEEITESFKPKMPTIPDSRNETIIDLQGKLDTEKRENASLRQLLHDEKDSQTIQKALPMIVCLARKVNADE